MVILKKRINMAEIEYVTPKMYLTQIYEGFCKDYQVPVRKPSLGNSLHIRLRDQTMDDLMYFVKDQGIECLLAKIKDRKSGLREGGGIETWLETYTLSQDIVLCTTKEFWSGTETDSQKKVNPPNLVDMITETDTDGRIKCWRLKEDRLTGKSHLILVNDPTALDELPQFGPIPSRKEFESAIDYVSRISQEAEELKIRLENKRIADKLQEMEEIEETEEADRLSKSMPTWQKPANTTEYEDRQARIDRINSIHNYWGWHED